MGSSVVGEPLGAVLTPPQVARFRLLAELGDTPVAVDLTGRNKYVLLTEDRAFLFPRQANNVEWFNRELDTYRALEPIGLPVIPRLMSEWRDDAVYPFPFAAVTRLHGVRPPDAGLVLDQLGRAVARWHDLAAPDLPGARPPAHHDTADMRWLRVHRASRLRRPTRSAASATASRVVLGSSARGRSIGAVDRSFEVNSDR